MCHLVHVMIFSFKSFLIGITFYIHAPGADPGFEKGGFNLVPKRDTGGATSTY